MTLRQMSDDNEGINGEQKFPNRYHFHRFALDKRFSIYSASQMVQYTYRIDAYQHQIESKHGGYFRVTCLAQNLLHNWHVLSVDLLVQIELLHRDFDVLHAQSDE